MICSSSRHIWKKFESMLNGTDFIDHKFQKDVKQRWWHQVTLTYNYFYFKPICYVIDDDRALYFVIKWINYVNSFAPDTDWS